MTNKEKTIVMKEALNREFTNLVQENVGAAWGINDYIKHASDESLCRFYDLLTSCKTKT